MSGMNNFIHLHTHSDIGSLQDGAQSVEMIASKAASLGMDSVALTDHGRCGGLLKFKKACEKHKVKPIYGIEFYVAPREHTLKERIEDYKTSYHLIALAKNQTGLSNIFQLSSIGWIEGFYYKPRISLELLKRYSEGLVILSGCGAGFISQMLMEDRPKEARDHIYKLRDIFKNDFYIEVQNHGLDWQQPLKPLLFEVSDAYNIPIVATQDSHYQNREDADLHRAICKLAAGDLEFEGNETYFKGCQEMEDMFAPEEYHAIYRTQEIADKCNCNWEYGKTIWPAYPLKDKTPEQELRDKAYEGLNKRFRNSTEEYRNRIEYELGVISKMGFPTYFLVIADLINWAKTQEIPVGPGRGSAAGSLVCYCLGITEIDPIEYDLYFERFLNESRISLPDIDLDICKKRREEVVDYLKNKYGQDRVSQIGTYSEFKPRGSLRAFARVLGYPQTTGDELANMVPPNVSGKTLTFDEVIEANPKILKHKAQDVVSFARQAEKLNCQAGIHAAGILISNTNISSQIPLYTGKHGEIASQFDMGDVEEIGLVKFDLLGLKNLTVINDTVKLIKQHNNADLYINNIPREDQKVFTEIFQPGKLNGIFQFETSSGFKEVCINIKPVSIKDLAIITSLYRPGPIRAGLVQKYIDGKNGKGIEYLTPKLKPILSDTYGIMVFQEQVLKICTDVAGYTKAEADNVRKCVAEGTLLKTEDGYKRIEEIVGEKQNILTFHNWQNKYNIAKNIFYSGIKQTIKITTTSKTELLCTPEHKIFTQRGWVQAKNLRQTDYLLHVLEPSYGNKYIDNDILFIITALITEGYTPSNISHWYFCNSDNYYIELFKDSIRRKFGYTPRTNTNDKGVIYCHLKKETVKILIDKYNLTPGLSEEKKLPDIFISLPEKQTHRLLGLLIDFDGYIVENVQAFYGSKSPELIKQIKLIMENCGLGAYIEQKKVLNHGMHYICGVGDSLDLLRLKEIIEPYSKKAKLLNKIKDTNGINSRYIIPKNLFHKHIDPLITASGYTRHELIGEDTSGTFFTKDMSIQRVKRILDKIGRSKCLEYFTNRKAYWDKVASVEMDKIRKVYDFSMHSGVSPCGYTNNLLVHNCVGKKIPEKMKAEREKFVSGCTANGVEKNAATKLFDDIDGYSSYCFNACLTEDTLVLTNNKTSINIAQIREQLNNNNNNNILYLKSIDLECNRVINDRCINVIDTGIQEVYEVCLSNNKKIRCTMNHKFLCLDMKMHTLKDILQNNLELYECI